MNRRLASIAAAALLVGLGAPAAFAGGSPNDKQYGNVIAAEASPPPPAKPAPLATSTPPSGTLPFTGVDLAVVVGGGLLATAGGFALRRLGRKQRDQL